MLVTDIALKQKEDKITIMLCKVPKTKAAQILTALIHMVQVDFIIICKVPYTRRYFKFKRNKCLYVNKSRPRNCYIIRT